MCIIPIYAGKILYKNGFSHTDDVTWLAAWVLSTRAARWPRSRKSARTAITGGKGWPAPWSTSVSAGVAGRGVISAYITGYSEAAIRLYGKLGWRKLKRWYHYELI